MQQIRNNVSEVVKELKTTKKFSQVLKKRMGHLPPELKSHLKALISKTGTAQLDLVRFDSVYGEYGFTLKSGATLLT